MKPAHEQPPQATADETCTRLSLCTHEMTRCRTCGVMTCSVAIEGDVCSACAYAPKRTSWRAS